MNQKETLAYLDKLQAEANSLSKLYFDLAEEVAGFESEEAYQAAASEIFETEQELAEEFDSCRKDAS